MALTKEKSILIIAPSLIAESLSLKLTSLDNDLNISLNSSTQDQFPELIIWNILNYQSEDLIRLELVKLKERWDESKILIIFSGQYNIQIKNLPNLNSDGLLFNPSADKVLRSINTILEGGRVFDIETTFDVNKKPRDLTFNQKLLTSGLKQIDREINHIYFYLNNDSTPSFYKFILRGRLRELVTSKGLLIFLWGNSLDLYTEQIFEDDSDSINDKNTDTVFIKDKNSYEIWNLIFQRLLDKYSSRKLNNINLNTTIILSGIKEEYISRLICNLLTELNSLINNLKANYKDSDYEEQFNSFVYELRKNTISNITDNYLRIKKGKDSISIKEYINNEYLINETDSFENDFESHETRMFIEPILKNEALLYEGKLLPLYETETFKILESIISNWIIRTSNILASELFNYCSKWPELRNTLIIPELQSTRSFERFRNNINNFNRWHDNISMPIYCYESKREYLDIMDNTFIRYFKIENREIDLKNLDWFQKQITLIVEIRDALAPQLEIAIKYIGNILVTILTRVLGRSIGLIGKGILQGLGRTNQK